MPCSGHRACLQPVTGERFKHRTASRVVGARLDIVAQSFWGRDRQCAYLMSGIQTFLAERAVATPSLANAIVTMSQRSGGTMMRVREVEHRTFSPLVFFITGGIGVVYKRIASLIANKYSKPYSKMLHWFRCRLSFSLLYSAVMCLQGSRSSVHNPAHSPSATMEVACPEGRIPFYT